MLQPGSYSSAPRRRAGLYVHVPFCETKCGYCDFYSIPLNGRETAPLVAALRNELRLRATGENPIETVFVGGGTPTLLPGDELTVLLAAITRTIPQSDRCEFTVEANPATVDEEKAVTLARAGVTRVSMGVQSFFANELAVLERLHSPDEIPSSVETLRCGGIEQVNLDLIFGIPGQTLATWAESLRRVIELRPEHVACYGLTYEPGTRLTAQRDHRRVTPCDEGLEADMYLLAIETLADAGYQQYEISNFARPGSECRHNLNYWRNGPYIGVGPSAAGCVGQRRYRNAADIGAYIRGIERDGQAEAYSEILDEAMLAMEMVMMQLRLNEGLSTVALRERTGLEAALLFESAMDRLAERGLVIAGDGRIRLTRQGRLMADHVIRELAACIPSPKTSRALTVLS